MSNVVIDVLLVKHIEKTIGRSITSDEYQDILDKKWLILSKQNGTLVSYKVDTFTFPYEVMTELLNVTQIDQYQTQDFLKEVEDWRTYNGDDGGLYDC